MLPTSVKACICEPTNLDYLSYMDTTTLQFGTYDCLTQPRSDMGPNNNHEPNPACKMQTYHGGLQCCRHSWFLADRNQDSMIPKDRIDTYFLKSQMFFKP